MDLAGLLTGTGSSNGLQTPSCTYYAVDICVRKQEMGFYTSVYAVVEKEPQAPTSGI